MPSCTVGETLLTRAPEDSDISSRAPPLARPGRNGADDGAAAIGDFDLGALFHRPQMPRQLILQVGDLDSLHGLIRPYQDLDCNR